MDPLRQLEEEVEAELRFHLEEEVERRVAAGSTVEAARAEAMDEAEWERARRACLALGRERLSREGREDVMDGLRRDVALALRKMRRNPGFAAVAILTLALGVGANAAVFGVLERVVLRPLPYPDPDRLVQVWPQKNFNSSLAREIEERSPPLAAVAGIARWQVNLTGEGDPAALEAELAHPALFDMLGARPQLGRFFTEAEAVEEGFAGERGPVVLSDALWRGRFGADPAVLGRVVELSGHGRSERVVVGVMAPGFRSPADRDADVWIPLTVYRSRPVSADSTWYVNWVVGRLAEGAELSAAAGAVRSAAGEIRAEHPSAVAEEEVARATVRPLRELVVGEAGGTLWMLLAVSGLVLLIACANLANLLLARGEGQARETAVRSVLGATRGRLLRQGIIESLVLGVFGGVVGIVLAGAALELLSEELTRFLPRGGAGELSVTAFLFALLATVAAVVLSSAGPTLRVVRSDLQTRLRSGSRGAGVGRGARRMNRALVAGEVALATVVVVLAAGVGKAFWTLLRVDPGFRPEGVVTVEVPVPSGRYPRGEAEQQFARTVLDAVRAVPAVESAGLIHLLPLTVNNWAFPILPDGFEPSPDDPLPSANFRVVAGDYFGTLGIPLRSGEAFPTEGIGPPEDRMWVNEAFVREFFPDGDVLGRTVRVFGSEPFQVAGVVGDVRQHGLDREPLSEMYVPYSRFNAGRFYVMARPRVGSPEALGAAIREAVWSVDAAVPVPNVQLLSQVRAESVGRERLVARLLGAFALLALVLGLVGVYGVATVAVRTRLREMGVRLAVGARPAEVLRGAVGSELRPVAAGLVLGVGAALLGGRVVESLLVGTSAGDPVVLVAVVMLLGGAGSVAAYLPARRATHRLDPVSVLRSE